MYCDHVNCLIEMGRYNCLFISGRGGGHGGRGGRGGGPGGGKHNYLSFKNYITLKSEMNRRK